MIEIEKLINTPYTIKEERDRECWSFCKMILGLLELPVPKTMRHLKRVDDSKMGDIVLFNLRDGNWHTGIAWPNPLFFIHVRPPLDSHLQEPFMIERRSVQDPVFGLFIDGFFR